MVETTPENILLFFFWQMVWLAFLSFTAKVKGKLHKSERIISKSH